MQRKNNQIMMPLTKVRAMARATTRATLKATAWVRIKIYDLIKFIIFSHFTTVRSKFRNQNCKIALINSTILYFVSHKVIVTTIQRRSRKWQRSRVATASSSVIGYANVQNCWQKSRRKVRMATTAIRTTATTTTTS